MDIRRCRQKARRYIDDIHTAKIHNEPSSGPDLNALPNLDFPHLVEGLNVRDHSADMQRVRNYVPFTWRSP